MQSMHHLHSFTFIYIIHVESPRRLCFCQVQKAPILSWRQSHPYILALRWEDQTDPTLAETAPRHRLDPIG